MFHIDFKNSNQKIHFIGIGGISMSGLAQIMIANNFSVSGSDMASSKSTKHLQDLGVTVFCGHSAANISKDIDLVVYTAAISQDNPELMAVYDNKIPCLSRAEFLGQLMKNYNYPVCISGTHGKTTTTSMLSNVLLSAQVDPTITVGGILDSIQGNIRIGHSEYFVTEACEYCDSFLNFNPKIGVILNMEEDHMDYFKDINHIRQSFYKFAQKIPSDGILIINSAIDNVDSFIQGLDCKIESFGLDQDDTWHASNITYDENAFPSFDVNYKGRFLGRVSLSVPGEHNIYNALSVCASANYMDIPFNSWESGFKSYAGTNQRFEIKGDLKGITIIDDYAHHPTEVEVTLEVAKKRKHNKIWCVFQPHTYTRMKIFLNDFANALSLADEVIVSNIYAAREKDPGDIHSQDLVESIHNLGNNAIYIDNFEDITKHLLEHCVPGDIIITMGAGNINIVADELLGN